MHLQMRILLSSLLWKICKVLDHQAYIRIALTGKSFYVCAYDAFEIIWENAARFAALGGGGAVFNNLGKL